LRKIKADMQLQPQLLALLPQRFLIGIANRKRIIFDIRHFT